MSVQIGPEWPITEETVVLRQVVVLGPFSRVELPSQCKIVKVCMASGHERYSADLWYVRPMASAEETTEVLVHTVATGHTVWPGCVYLDTIFADDLPCHVFIREAG